MKLNQAIIGTSIPDFVVRPTHANVFMFSAVTWNRHHIHYNKDAAIEEGLPDVVVQRGLIGNYYVRALVNWTGEIHCVSKIEWKMKSSALPNEEIIFKGKIFGIDRSEKKIICKLEAASANGRLISKATASVSY